MSTQPRWVQLINATLYLYSKKMEYAKLHIELELTIRQSKELRCGIVGSVGLLRKDTAG